MSFQDDRRRVKAHHPAHRWLRRDKHGFAQTQQAWVCKHCGREWPPGPPPEPTGPCPAQPHAYRDTSSGAPGIRMCAICGDAKGASIHDEPEP